MTVGATGHIKLISATDTLPPPERMFVEITTECNLHCRQCHHWRLKDPVEQLSTEEKLAVVRQFSELSPHGHIVFNGGETMQKTQEFFRLSGLCRDLGIYCVANSNGTYISDDNIEQTIRRGPNILVLSMDSHREELHDYIRGTRGAWRRLMQTIEKLLEVKQKLGADDTEIQLMGIVFRENLHLWEDHVEFARNLGVSKVMFQLLSPTFQNQNVKRDVFFEKHFLENTSETLGTIDQIEKKYLSDPFVNHTARDYESMRIYLKNPQQLAHPVCGSHLQNIMLDTLGRVKLCFSMARVTDSGYVGNVRESALSDLWYSDVAGEARVLMDACRLPCGMLQCHRKIH